MPQPSSLINCSDLSSCFQSLYNLLFSFLIAFAFFYFLYGAIEYLGGGANIFSQQSGRSKMINAVSGIIIVFLVGILLNMISPNIFTATWWIPKFTVVPVKFTTVNLNIEDSNSTGAGSTQGAGKQAKVGDGYVVPRLKPEQCTSAGLQKLAQENQVPYPAKRDPMLNLFLNCIAEETGVALPPEGGSNKFYGSVFTYDHSHPSCNYTRGTASCEGICFHHMYSCHYLGRNCHNGAVAVDFGNQDNQKIAEAAERCGKRLFPKAGAYILKEGDHWHISIGRALGCGCQ